MLLFSIEVRQLSNSNLQVYNSGQASLSLGSSPVGITVQLTVTIAAHRGIHKSDGIFLVQKLSFKSRFSK